MSIRGDGGYYVVSSTNNVINIPVTIVHCINSTTVNNATKDTL